MKYQMILFNCKNGLERLESKISDIKPTDKFAEECREFYGAEKYEIIEMEK